MTTTNQRISEYLNSLGITQSPEIFVSEVSNIYHKIESELYDDLHIEIHETSSYWINSLISISSELPKNIRVLDIGTGTGFASEQVLKIFGNRISELVCQDISMDMLEQCRVKLTKYPVHVTYFHDSLENIPLKLSEFDLVITNALLHHLINLPLFFELLQKLVRPGGFYIAGHEPCSLFYVNKELYQYTRYYRYWRNWKRFFSIKAYLRHLGIISASKGIDELTNEELLNCGVVKTLLPLKAIRSLVDIHVPPADDSAPFWGEKGFDPYEMSNRYLSNFKLRYLKTYSYIKDARGRMNIFWSFIDNFLSKKYPGCGANFLLIFQKVG